MFLDYKRVAIDFTKEFPKNKLYYTPRFLLAGAFVYGVLTVPTEQDHQRKVLSLKHKMINYGTNRNPTVNEYVQKMVSLDNRGLLSHTDYWAFSIVHKNIYPVECGCSEAVYSRLKHRWWNPVSYFYSVPSYLSSIVDLGIFGRFVMMELNTGDHNLPDVNLVNQMNMLHKKPDILEFYPNKVVEGDDLKTAVVKRGKHVFDAVGFYVNPGKYGQVPVREQRQLDITNDDW